MRLLLTVLVAFVATELARADCPTNTVVAIGATRTSSAPRDTLARDFRGCVPHPMYCYSYSASVDYDLVIGRVHAYAQGSNAHGEGYALTHDVFTLIGPASESPITFTANGHAVLAQYCDQPYATVFIREGDSNIASVAGQPCSTVATSIGVSITCLPGSSFDLYMYANARAGGGVNTSGGVADATLNLKFSGVPVGYTLVSCQGYAGEPVATRPRSWGAVKALYR